jgi:hypothetical protein
MVVLSAAAVVLAGALLVELRLGSRPPLPSVAPQPAADLPEIPGWEVPVPPMSKYGEIIERPLFTSDRRPPPPDEQPVAETQQVTPQTKPDVRLLGIVITEGKRQALLQEGRDDKVVYAEPGVTVQGWTVESIESEQVVLVLGEQREEIDLRTFEVPPTTSAAQGAPLDRRAALEAQRQRALERLRQRREALRERSKQGGRKE